MRRRAEAPRACTRRVRVGTTGHAAGESLPACVCAYYRAKLGVCAPLYRMARPNDSIPAASRREMPDSMISAVVEDLHGEAVTRPLQVLAGELPAGLGGHLFVSGALADPGRPAFTGEGVLYRVDFAEHGAHITRAVLRPPCFHADHALRDSDHGALLQFHDLGLTRLSPLLGVRTVLGTAPVALHDRMIVASDTGRPWEFDPRSLELVTPLGRSDEWRGAVPAPWLFPLILTSAHPAADAGTGELFTANFCNPGLLPGFCRLVRWSGPGALEHFLPVDERGEPVEIHQCVHQIGVTRNHVILQDSAFVVEKRQMLADAVDLLLPGAPAEALLPASISTHRPTTVLHLIPRAALTPGSGGPVDAPTPVRSLRIELAQESVHFFADFDDDDVLTIVVPHTPTLDVSEWIRAGERMLDGGRADALADLPAPCALTPGTIAVHTLDPATGRLLATRGVTGEATWGLGLGTPAPAGPGEPLARLFFNTSGFFPELIPQRLLRAYADRVDVASLPIADGRSPRLLAFTLADGQLDSWECPPGWCVLSPCFVPRDGDPRTCAGHVVCLAHAAAGVPRPSGTSGEELWIFDAEHITRGPVCRLGRPDLDFAFTIHAAWVPALQPSPRDYHVSAAQDLDLELLHHQSFGALSFSGVFSAAIGAALQRDVVTALLAEHVLPHFDP